MEEMLRRLFPVFVLLLVVLGSLSVFASSGVITSKQVLDVNMHGHAVYLVADRVVRTGKNNYTWTITYVKPALELMNNNPHVLYAVVYRPRLNVIGNMTNATLVVKKDLVIINSTVVSIYRADGGGVLRFRNAGVTFRTVRDQGFWLTRDIIAFSRGSIVIRDGVAYGYSYPTILYHGKPYFVVGVFNATGSSFYWHVTGAVGLVLSPVYGGRVVRIVTTIPYFKQIQLDMKAYSGCLVVYNSYFYLFDRNVTVVLGDPTSVRIYVIGNYIVCKDYVYSIRGVHDRLVYGVGSFPRVRLVFLDSFVKHGWVVVDGVREAYLGYYSDGGVRPFSGGDIPVWITLNGFLPFVGVTDVFGEAVVRGWVDRVGGGLVRVHVDMLPIVGNMTLNISIYGSGVLAPVRDGGVVLDLGMVRLVLPLSNDSVVPLLREYGLLRYAHPLPVSTTSIVRTSTETTTQTTTQTTTITHAEGTITTAESPATVQGVGGGFAYWWVVPVVAVIVAVVVGVARARRG